MLFYPACPATLPAYVRADLSSRDSKNLSQTDPALLRVRRGRSPQHALRQQNGGSGLFFCWENQTQGDVGQNRRVSRQVPLNEHTRVVALSRRTTDVDEDLRDHFP